MGSKARSVSIGAIAAAAARLLEFPAGLPVVALLAGIVLAEAAARLTLVNPYVYHDPRLDRPAGAVIRAALTRR